VFGNFVITLTYKRYVGFVSNYLLSLEVNILHERMGGSHLLKCTLHVRGSASIDVLSKYILGSW